jgi:hypothetical protein
MSFLVHQYNQYASSARDLNKRFELPDDLRNRSLRKLAERIQSLLTPARNSIAHPYRAKLGSRGSAERAASLDELLQVYQIEINMQELFDTFRKFHKAARSADACFAHGMSLFLLDSDFLRFLKLDSESLVQPHAALAEIKRDAMSELGDAILDRIVALPATETPNGGGSA